MRWPRWQKGGVVNRQKQTEHNKVDGCLRRTFFEKICRKKLKTMQPPGRIELPTPGLQDQCSNHWAMEAHAHRPPLLSNMLTRKVQSSNSLPVLKPRSSVPAVRFCPRLVMSPLEESCWSTSERKKLKPSHSYIYMQCSSMASMEAIAAV